jgi:uncharacterized membrane protein
MNFKKLTMLQILTISIIAIVAVSVWMFMRSGGRIEYTNEGVEGEDEEALRRIFQMVR